MVPDCRIFIRVMTYWNTTQGQGTALLEAFGRYPFCIELSRSFSLIMLGHFQRNAQVIIVLYGMPIIIHHDLISVLSPKQRYAAVTSVLALYLK